ncbi:unnamed protein product [Clonostachys rosea]|uniref:Uncharacterized protein n=1 Tax=Bionectria ochroleuca TaxID=29856 RepID=A0ABY6TQH6_BIOOC|nr:unnamed protein product [Clonostachys rosea]
MSSWPDDIDIDPGIFFDPAFYPQNIHPNPPMPLGEDVYIFDPGPSLRRPMPVGNTLGLQGFPPGYPSSLQDSACFASQWSNTTEEAMLLATYDDYVPAQADATIAHHLDEIYDLTKGIGDSSLVTSYKAHPGEFITTAPLSPARGPGSMI